MNQITVILRVSNPEGGRGNPLQYSCLENPHGQRSLVGYSPWIHKELDTTEQQAHQQSLHTGFYAYPFRKFSLS